MFGTYWFAMAIPALLVAVLLYFPKLRKRTKWWEIAVPALVTMLIIVICQYVTVSSALKDYEYWGHLSYSAIHEEPFAYDSECSRQVQTGQT